MLIKIVGIALTALAPTLWGFSRSRALRMREAGIDGLIFLVAELKQGIYFFHAPLSELAGRLKENAAVKKYPLALDLLLRIAAGTSPEQAWEACDRGVCGIGEQTVMDELFVSLGRTDAAGQSALCENALSRLQSIKEATAAQAAEKGRLYRSLGLLAGAFFAIILL